MATIIVAVLVLGDHIILPITRSQCISRLAPAARRQQRSSSSTSSTYTTEDDSGDIIHSSLLGGGGSASSISKPIAGRLIRNKNTQRQQRKSPTDTTESTDGAMPTQQQQQFRGDQRLLVRHLNNIPVHSLGNSNLSATDLYRWRHVNPLREKKDLNNKQNETMFGSNKGRLGYHRNTNHYLGGSIVALQSATVKYRQLRLQQQQHQQKQRNKESIFSSTELHNNNVTGSTSYDNHDGRGVRRRHQLKTNLSAKTIPLKLPSSDTIIITSHSTIQNSKASSSSSASVEANERYDGASTKTTSTTTNGWLFAPWLWGRRNEWRRNSMKERTSVMCVTSLSMLWRMIYCGIESFPLSHYLVAVVLTHDVHDHTSSRRNWIFSSIGKKSGGIVSSREEEIERVEVFIWYIRYSLCESSSNRVCVLEGCVDFMLSWLLFLPTLLVVLSASTNNVGDLFA